MLSSELRQDLKSERARSCRVFFKTMAIGPAGVWTHDLPGQHFLKYLLSTFLAFIENFLDDPVKENLLFIGYHIISGVPGKSCWKQLLVPRHWWVFELRINTCERNIKLIKSLWRKFELYQRISYINGISLKKLPHDFQLGGLQVGK